MGFCPKTDTAWVVAQLPPDKYTIHQKEIAEAIVAKFKAETLAARSEDQAVLTFKKVRAIWKVRDKQVMEAAVDTAAVVEKKEKKMTKTIMKKKGPPPKIFRVAASKSMTEPQEALAKKPRLD
jgi:hypothetical protein